MVYTICVFLILKNMNPETSWLLSKSCRARKLVSTFELYGVYMMYIETKWCMFVWFVCVRLCLPSFRPSPNFLSLSLSSWVTTVHGSKRLSGLIVDKCITNGTALRTLFWVLFSSFFHKIADLTWIQSENVYFACR